MTDDVRELDALDEAENAKVPEVTRTVFGELMISAWSATWEPTGEIKPDGKPKHTVVPFDADRHDPDRRFLQIEMVLTPTKGNYNIERKMMDRSQEFAGIFKPSINKLGLKTKDVNGRYVKAELVPCGRKYINEATGEERRNTTFRILEVFPDMESCFEAAAKFFGQSNGFTMDANTTAATPAPAQPDPAAVMEKATAEKFLAPMLNAVNGDRSRFLEQLKTNPLLSRHFTESSPEVVKLIGTTVAVVAG